MQCCSIRGFRWIYVSGYAEACMAACMHHARMMHSMHCTQTCTYAPCKRCGCPHLHGCYAVVALHYCCVLLVLQVCRLLLGKETSAVCTVSKSVNTRALMRSECSDASWGPQYANTRQSMPSGLLGVLQLQYKPVPVVQFVQARCLSSVCHQNAVAMHCRMQQSGIH